MEPEIDIRPLQPADAAAWKALRMEAAHSPDFGSDPVRESAYSLEMLKLALVSDAGGYVLGAFADGDLIGMAGLGVDERSNPAKRAKGVIFGLYTARQWRGRHVARRLVDRLISLERTRCLTLEVRAQNEPAVRLYHNLGFEVVGKDDDRLLMARAAA